MFSLMHLNQIMNSICSNQYCPSPLIKKRKRLNRKKELVQSVTLIIPQSKPCIPKSDPVEESKVLTLKKKETVGIRRMKCGILMI